MRHLRITDPKLYCLVRQEIRRQKEGIDLIASENYASAAILEAAASPLTNKYSEGYPRKRYYAGNFFIDQIEQLAIDRVKKLFAPNPAWREKIHANVQPHSGSQANQAVYMALLNVGDKVLGIDLSCGGHLSHGSPVNFSGKFYHFVNYGVDEKTQRLDYQKITKIAKKEKPKLIVCGTTAYPRRINFRTFGKIAREVGAYLMADIAHIAGLVVAGVHQNPFPFADVVTFTTHKTMRGPRGGVILCRQVDRFDGSSLAQKIDKAVFPGLQGGPLEHIIAAKALCFLEASRASFKKYQQKIVQNAKAMAQQFKKEGLRLVSGGTDIHLILIDLSSLSVSAKQVQEELEKADIFTNRNSIPYDTRPPYDPSGLRVGTPAITTRGFGIKETQQAAKSVAAIIKNLGDKEVAKEVKKQVRALTKKFPVYENL